MWADVDRIVTSHEAEETLARINDVYSEPPPEDAEYRERRRQRHRALVEGTWSRKPNDRRPARGRE